MRQALDTAHAESSAEPNNLSMQVFALVGKKTSSRLEAPTQDTGWDSQRVLCHIRSLPPDSISAVLSAKRSQHFSPRQNLRADGLEPVHSAPFGEAYKNVSSQQEAGYKEAKASEALGSGRGAFDPADLPAVESVQLAGFMGQPSSAGRLRGKRRFPRGV